MSTKFYILMTLLVCLPIKAFCSDNDFLRSTTLSVMAETRPGESIYVQGQHPLLGNGSVVHSIRLNPKKYPNWELVLDFSHWQHIAKPIKYRYIKRRDHAEEIAKEENYTLVSEWQDLLLPSQLSNKYPRRISPRYRLQIMPEITSRYLNFNRPIYIFKPVEYRAKIPLCLLYMHDAQQLFKNGPTGWQLDTFIPHSPIQNYCQLIVIGIGNSPDRMREYLPPYSQGPSGVGYGDKYSDFFARELMPYIEQNLLSGQPIHRRVLAGASMGGLISLYFADTSIPWARANRFDGIMAFSPSLQFSEILNNLQHISGRIYIDSGSVGPSADHFQEVNYLRDMFLNQGMIFGRNILHRIGIEHVHQEQFWRIRLQENLFWAFNP